MTYIDRLPRQPSHFRHEHHVRFADLYEQLRAKFLTCSGFTGDTDFSEWRDLAILLIRTLARRLAGRENQQTCIPSSFVALGRPPFNTFNRLVKSYRPA